MYHLGGRPSAHALGRAVARTARHRIVVAVARVVLHELRSRAVRNRPLGAKDSPVDVGQRHVGSAPRLMMMEIMITINVPCH